jgi:hypothetical protein
MLRNTRIPLLKRDGGSDLALRELYIQSHWQTIRVFYAFDPRRDAIVPSNARITWFRPCGASFDHSVGELEINARFSDGRDIRLLGV